MKYPFSAQALQILDTHPQRVEYYAAIHKPAIVSRGTLSAIPDNYPGSQVLIKNLVGGLNLTDILAGMTLRVGSEGAKGDYGTLRVRENYSSGSIIKTAEFGSGLVNFIANACLTVVEEFKAWPIHHSYDTSLSKWKVDLQEYTSQLSLYGPQAIMGPPAVATLDGGKAVVPYVGNLSYSHTPGASITSQAWYFSNGETVTSALGSSAAPIQTTYINASPTGKYQALAVTDGNGSSHISKRLTFVFGSGIEQQPARVSFEAITGGLKAGGYRTRFTVLETASSSLISDGALVVIFEKASYGTIASSVGGNYYGRDNIVMVGRVLNESMRIDPFTQELSFALETIDGELRKSNAYDLFLEGSSAASDWDMASGLTLDRTALALTKHRSTISFVTDFHPASGAAATNEIYYRSLPAGNLWDQLSYNYDAAFGIVAADMQGTIWAGLDAQVTGLSANLPNIMAITKARRLNTTTIEHEHVDTNAQYRLYAIQGGAASPLGAESPGQRQGYFGNKQEVTRNLLVSDQDTLITWSGNVRARENNQYKRITTTLTGNIRLDSVPQSRVTMSLSATENRRNIEFINRVLIPTETVVNYSNNMYSNTDVVMEASVNGMGGSAITFPRTPISVTPPAPDPTPPPTPNEGDGNTVYVATYTKVGRTRNFLATSPTWADITGALSGQILDLILDPFDPVNSAYVLTATAIYKTGDLSSTSPTWTNKLTLAAIEAFSGKSNLNFRNLSASITRNGEIWVGIYQVTGAGAGTIAAVRTPDAFITYSYATIATASADGLITPDIHIQASNRSSGRAYAIGIANRNVASVYRSTDSNLTWAATHNFGAVRLQALEAAYAGSSETEELIFYVMRSLSNVYNVDRSLDGGVGFTNVLTPGTGPTGLARPARLVNVATHNPSDVILIVPGIALYDSTDGGNVWNSTPYTGAEWEAAIGLGRWPYNPDRIYLLTDAHIKYSINRGLVFDNKEGNWTSVMGGAFVDPINIVPVWTET